MSRKKIVNRFGAGLLASAMIAAGAISAGLSPAVAFAAVGQPVTINQQGNTAAEYDAFKVFDADVHKDNDDGGKYKATHLQWASPAMKSAVLTGTTGNDTPFADDDDNNGYTNYVEWLAVKYGIANNQVIESQRENPQNAAEYIAKMIDESAEATNTNTDPETKQGDSFAARLSRTLYAAGIAPTDSITTGSAKAGLAQGYWLVTSADPTIATGEVGSAPMWIAVSDEALEINAKEAIPTITKQVKDDVNNAAWGKIADAGVGEAENLDFQITADLPQNIDAYNSYSVSIADALPSGMVLKGNTVGTLAEPANRNVTVTLNGTDITQYLTGTVGSISYTGNVLTVSISDVKNSAALGNVNTLSEGDGGEIVVTYKAHLNDTANIGTATGNVNTATLTYSADPNDSSKTRAVADTANVITYAFELEKVDEVTRLPLSGAKFTISTEIGGTTYYVKQNGELTATAAEAYEFTTAPGTGLVQIPRLDEGTYTLHETVAPDHYELESNDAVLRITAVKNYANGTLDSLNASLSGWQGTFVTGREVADLSEDGVKPTPTAISDGILKGRLGNTLQIVLPLTGMPVKTAVLVGGVIIAGASIAVMVAKKRGNKQE